MDRAESEIPTSRRDGIYYEDSVYFHPVRGQHMQGGQQAVDIVALFFAPFFAVITALALVAFSPLGKLDRPIRFFLFGGIGSAVAIMTLTAVGLLGKVSNGIWRFDVVLSLIASALIGLIQFGSSDKLSDKTQDDRERVQKQDSGWF